MPLGYLPPLLVDEGGDIGQHLHGIADGLGTQGELTELAEGDDALVGGVEVVADIRQIDVGRAVIVAVPLCQKATRGGSGNGHVARAIQFFLGCIGQSRFRIHAPLGRGHGQGEHVGYVITDRFIF